MTDLDDLWARYPVPDAPLEDLLARGRRETRLRAARREASARRRRLVIRPLLVAGVVAAVGSAYAVGAHGGLFGGLGGAGGGSGQGAASSARDGGAGADAGLRASAFQADLHPATSCAALLADYRSRAAEQVSAYGLEASVHALAAVGDALGSPLASLPSPAVAGPSEGVASSATGTNVQEAGVDEPDEVKTDGSLLVRIADGTLTTYDVSGSAVSVVSHLRLPRLSGGQILLSGTTVVAVGLDTERTRAAGTRVETVSIADPHHPALLSDVRYSGTSVSARQHGTTIRLVLTQGAPSLPFVHPHAGLSTEEALTRNRAIVARSTLADWLPTYDNGSGSRRLLDCAEVALPPSGLALGTESVVGFDVRTPTAVTAIGIAGQTTVAYESADHLYLAAGGAGCGPGSCAIAPGAAGPVRSAGPSSDEGDTTTIFQFDLSGTAATHVATGELKGFLAGRWSMDEAGGILRVAVTHDGDSKQASAVVTLRPLGRELVELGRVEGLGVGETLTAARWFDDLAIVSTARRTDPVYTVDLSDPAHPRIAGALHLPGYTTYFHPIGDDLLLGVGQSVAFSGANEDDEKAQVGLFDISDPGDVRRLDTAALPSWTWPLANDDPRAFTWSNDLHTAFTAFSTRHGVLLGEYRVDGSTMTSRTVRVSTGHDPGSVRTLELPDHRVLLVAGSRVSFLDL
ncbi:beta-propeller domain-containing protein [Nocardioides sp. BP30]|uniref:beta-propeller domain-containing protein n=1 Tax=Nocardioides sp. BP30 TaxID=3036374 RepID=UPI00246910F4|nr:beta-propeller domain-containing protein [Nocardioides sp. BP30]WGL51181.1 beta-propeller domain-containing protein [Nocardioides sp. BP30]